MEFADRVLQISPSLTLEISSKAKRLKSSGVDVVDFGAGEPDFDTPIFIKKAGIKSIQDGFTKYTPASGMDILKKAVSEKLRLDNQLSYKPEEIVITCGAKHALYNIFQIICNPGDEVLFISPYWVSYPEMIKLSGAIPKVVNTCERTRFLPDPGLIDKAITKKTKALIINSPSNPTGAVFDSGLLKEIAKIAIKKEIYVISDEIYEKIIYKGLHVSIASVDRKIKKYAFVVNGVSKTYSMTGWRIGYMAGPYDAIKKISSLQSHSTSNPTSISQMAALAAIQKNGSFVHKMRREFIKRRDYIVKRINAMGDISCIKPEGAFYVFCNISKTGLRSLDFARMLLDEAHVACVPGIAFGSDNHIRISFATSMNAIKNGMDRLEKWLKDRISQKG